MDDLLPSDERTARFPFDQIYKALFCHRRTVADMLRRYLSEPHGPLRREVLDALDLRTLRKIISAEWVTREFRLRRGDQVWQASFRTAARSAGYPRFMLFNLEFQSRRDGEMALRFQEQGAELIRELRAQGVIAEGEPVPVLCVVVHNGRSPWTAPASAAEIACLPPAICPSPTIPANASAFYPWGYYTLDFAAYRYAAHVPGDMVSMMVGIEFARDRADLIAPLWETVRHIRDASLRRVVAQWLDRLRESYNLDLPGMEELLAMEDVTVLTSRFEETLDEWRLDALTEGRNEGRSEGQRALLTRMAAQRFGANAGEQLAALLADVDDWARLASASDRILDAETGEELANRVEELVQRTPDIP